MAIQTDSRVFQVRRNGRSFEVSIQRHEVTNWAPSAQSRNVTLVTLDNGKSMQVSRSFGDFHAWVIGPALERDKHLKETLAAKKELKATSKPRKSSKPVIDASPAEELIVI